jgi:hypothetical protein
MILKYKYSRTSRKVNMYIEVNNTHNAGSSQSRRFSRKYDIF